MGIFDAFTGKAQAKDLKRANNDATAEVNRGYDRAEGYIGDANTSAQGFLQPFAEGGQRYNALYQDALGINGAEGGQRAASAYSAGRSPYLDQMMARTENALLKSSNARGLNNSGAGALAAARARTDAEGAGYNDWLGRIGAQQGQGLQVAGQQAGIATGYGDRMSDLATGRSGTIAANRINYGNAQAATRGIGINNLLSIAGAATKGYSALYPKGIS
jgi:hypothetical protein